MAIIKCKMCGGDLELIPGATVCECEYCGTKQTVPAADNEKKLGLFARANKLRAACEFDKAAGVFETIVAEFPEEAEAYWGLVLCKYGIEYVTDPATGKKIPTCHRSGYESVMDDANLELAMENTDALARKVYREEAGQIEELRKSIIEVSSKEEPYDIFICYKETDAQGQRTLDSVLAQDLYKELTREGYRVFFSRITLEHKLGVEYEPYIFAALNSAKVMLAVGTDYEHFNAVWVKNEWSRYLKLMEKDHTKHLIPCYREIGPYDMPKEFMKLQGQDLGKVGAIQDLLYGIEKLMPKKLETVAPQPAAEDPRQVLLSSAQTYIELGDFDTALKKYKELTDKYPSVSQGWWGCVFCITRGLSAANVDLKQLTVWMKNAKKTDKTGAYPAMEKQYLEYLKLATESLTTSEESNMIHTVRRNREQISGLENKLQQMNSSEGARKTEVEERKKKLNLEAYQTRGTRSKGKGQVTKGNVQLVIGILLVGIAVFGLITEGISWSSVLIAVVIAWIGWAVINTGRDNKKDGNGKIRNAVDIMTRVGEELQQLQERDSREQQEHAKLFNQKVQELERLKRQIAACESYMSISYERRHARCIAQYTQAIDVVCPYDPEVQKLFLTTRVDDSNHTGGKKR